MDQGPIQIEESEEETRQARIRKNQRAIQLLRSWDDAQDDLNEVRALDELKAAIDANRTGPRKHFS